MLLVSSIALVVVMATVFEFRKGPKPVGWQKGNSLTGHSSPILAVAFSPDGQRLASGDQEGNVPIWEWANSEQRYPPWRSAEFFH
jgi:WD40 repeat protein